MILNGEAFEMDGTTAQDLIHQLGYQNQRIALEVNEVIVPKSKYATSVLDENDKIEIIKAVGGG